MADIKEEQEREELHRAIWAMADDLCGIVDSLKLKRFGRNIRSRQKE